jgi:hypothetical protein
MIINLKQEGTGLVKTAKLGFSFTTFFFGVFVPLIRGDIKWAFIMFILSFLTFELSWLVFPFVYNKIYIRDLISKGYKPADERSSVALTSRYVLV